jgi:hypothetical protein
MAYLKILFQHSARGAEGNKEIAQSKWTATQPE